MAIQPIGGVPAERRVFAATPVWRKTVRPNAL